ncbi:MAG: hypothetical protein AB1352_00960 [Patescibacteria group bacterium]
MSTAFLKSVSLTDLLTQVGDKLGDVEFLDGLKRRAEEMMFFGYVAESAALLNDLNAFLHASPEFAIRYPEQYHALQRMMVILRWTVFHTVKSDTEAIDLFAHHLVQALESEGFDIWEKVKAWFLTYPLLDDRDRLKVVLREALEKNQEPFGQIAPLLGERVLMNSALTIGQWLQRVVVKLGKKIYTALDVNSFLSSDEQARRLPTKQQEQLRTLITLYGHLLKSSLTLEGMEDAIPIDESDIKGTIREGKFEPIKEIDEVKIKKGLQEMREVILHALGEEAPADIVENLGGEAKRDFMVNKMIKKYEQWTLDTVIAPALAQLEQAGGSGANEEEELNGFYSAVNKGDIVGVLTCLWRLARRGSLKQSFGKSERFVKYWKHQLEKRESRIMNQESGDNVGALHATPVQEFLKDPAAPKYFLAFLKHVLIDRLKLTEESAKLAVLTLSNECRKAGDEEYAHLAYGDLETGEFKWNA